MNRLQLIWHGAIASGAALKTLVAHHATRRKLADEALRESERRFRRLAELSNDFFWETDTEHRYTMLDYGTIHRGQPRLLLGRRGRDLGMGVVAG